MVEHTKGEPKKLNNYSVLLYKSRPRRFFQIVKSCLYNFNRYAMKDKYAYFFNHHKHVFLRKTVYFTCFQRKSKLSRPLLSILVS